MSSKIAEAFVEVSAQRGKMTQGLNAARGEINEFANRSREKMAELGKSLLLFGGIGAGVLGIEKILEKTADGEKAAARLRVALKSVGEAANAGEFNEFADALSDVYGVESDVAREAMTLAINLGASGNNIKDVTQAAVGLADVLGTDLKEATETVMKAQEGNFKAFEKMFPAMKQLTTSDEKLAMVSRIAAQGLEQKRAVMATLGGSTERLKLSMGELEKSIGGLVSAPLSGWFDDVSGAIKVFTSGTEEAERTVLGLAIAAQKVKQFGQDFVSDAFGSQRTQKTIDELEKMREESINRSVKVAGDAVNKETNLRLQALHRVEDATRETFGKIEDIYFHAQEAMLKGGDIIGIGNAAKGNGFAAPAGGLHFKNEGANAGGGAAQETARQRAARRAYDANGVLRQNDEDPESVKQRGLENGDASEVRRAEELQRMQQRQRDKYFSQSDKAEFGSEKGAAIFRQGVKERQRQKELEKSLGDGPETSEQIEQMESLQRSIDSLEKQFKDEKAKTDKLSIDDSKPLSVSLADDTLVTVLQQLNTTLNNPPPAVYG
jgi:hypothetical protein